MKLKLAIFASIIYLSLAPVAHAQWVQCNGPYQGGVSWLSSAGSILFAGTDSGVYRSNDNGLDWIHADTGLPKKWASSIIINGTNFLAANPNGIFRSSDSGASWFAAAKAGFDDSGAYALAFMGTNYFAGGNGFFRSSDSGGTWLASNKGLTNSGIQVHNIYALAVMGTNLFAGTDNINGVGIFRSTDSGKSWAPGGLTAASVNYIAVSGNTLFVATGDGVIIYSTDNGSSWSAPILPNSSVHFYSVAANGQTLIAGTENGTLYTSKDGGKNWLATGQSFFTGRVCIKDSNFFAASNDGIFRSTDTGNSWFQASRGLPLQWVNLIGVSGQSLVVRSFNRSAISRSTDDGLSWIGVTVSGETLNTFATPLGIYCCGNVGPLYRSIDEGVSWIEMTSSGPIGISGMCSSGSDLIVASSQGLYRSTDSGATWNSTTSAGLTFPSLATLSGQLFTSSGSDIYAVTKGALNISKDGGASWSEVYINGQYFLIVQSLTSAGSNVFVGTLTDTGNFDTHVFLSSDEGKDWSNVSEGLIPFVQLNSLAVSGGYIFAALSGDGIWRRPLSDFGISSVAEQPLKSNESIRSFPNPFSHSTQIAFTSASVDYAEIYVVNALGAEVARLFSGTLAAGEHTFSWNAGSAAPGNYWCIVRMGGQVERIGLLRE